MTVFSWLLVGHFLGDWLLQNDWMARGKKEGVLTASGLAHFTIYTFVTMEALLIAGIAEKGSLFVWGVATFIFVSHWIIDSTPLVDHWMKLYGQTDIAMVRVMVDQTFHLLVLVGISLAL